MNLRLPFPRLSWKLLPCWRLPFWGAFFVHSIIPLLAED